MKNMLFLLLATFSASSLSAQNVVLSEDFNANIVPPTGWQNINLGDPTAAGWIADGNGRAWHQDEPSPVTQCENILATPPMDLTGLSSAYVHFSTETYYVTYMAHNPNPLGNGISTLEVSTDGGATWTVVWTDDTLVDNQIANEVVDISAYAGQTNVMVGHHYSGDYAHEVWLDNFQVDDDPTVPPIPGTTFFPAVTLPTSFASLPLNEDFSAGLQPYMATMAIDSISGLPDPEAWCDVSNGELQMGLIPGSVNYHNVRNSLVMGIDGASLPNGNLNIDFTLVDFGEENNSIDGCWVSEDGLEWFPVLDGWPGSVNQQDLQVTGLGADTSGDFYIMFGQEDNFPHADLDGVTIDNIIVDAGTGPPPGQFFYSISNFVGGQTATMQVINATPGAPIVYGYSLTGSGPTNTPYGVVDMSNPIKILTIITADSTGTATYLPTVPNFPGLTIYTQCLDRGVNAISNSLAPTIQ